jgi:hypothetical protein
MAPKNTYRRLPCRRKAIGAEGSWMVLHASGTFTSRIALRVTFFKVDFEPSVATSLVLGVSAHAIQASMENEPDGCHAVLSAGEDCARVLALVESLTYRVQLSS